MQKLEIKADDITEEKILDLVNYLDTGVLPEGMTESKLATLYGRLKARGNVLEQAEAWLKPCYDKKKENYKWKILNDIKQGIEEMKHENGLAGHYQYEIANIKSRANGKTMQIGFRDIDVNDKLKWRHSILIEENKNPEFFQEMLDRYAPKEIFTSNEKPF